MAFTEVPQLKTKRAIATFLAQSSRVAQLSSQGEGYWVNAFMRKGKAELVAMLDEMRKDREHHLAGGQFTMSGKRA